MSSVHYRPPVARSLSRPATLPMIADTPSTAQMIVSDVRQYETANRIPLRFELSSRSWQFPLVGSHPNRCRTLLGHIRSAVGRRLSTFLSRAIQGSRARENRACHTNIWPANREHTGDLRVEHRRAVQRRDCWAARRFVIRRRAGGSADRGRMDRFAGGAGRDRWMDRENSDQGGGDLQVVEIRHRLANCFQLLNGLIQARLAHTADGESRRQLAWLQDVVVSMGILQQRLAAAGNAGFPGLLGRGGRALATADRSSATSRSSWRPRTSR